MQVKQVMTPSPTCCVAETSLQEVAKMMVENDCGEIPVVDSNETKRPVGVVTDRDIVVRTLAQERNPLDLTANDCMSSPCVTVTEEMSIDDCSRVMEENKIRRVPVVDKVGAVCGIVALADLALRAKDSVAGDVVKEVSEPTTAASAAAGS